MAAGELSDHAERQAKPGIVGIPVFMYHEIVESGQRSYSSPNLECCVTPEQFRDHLMQIRQGGYQVRSVRDIAEPGTCASLDHGVGITFDDGCSSDYEKAFPVLAEAGMRADFFLNTANIGKPGYMNWAQIEEMRRSGMAFHSHGHSHVALSMLSPRALERELAMPRKIMEDKLGCAVDFLAAPYGLLNRRVIQEAFRLGYRAVCNSRQWTATAGSRVINRAAVLRRTSAKEFGRLLRRDPLPYVMRSLRSAVFYAPRQMMLKIQPAWLTVQVLEEKG